MQASAEAEPATSRRIAFPWRKPRRELLVLVLVAFAALSPNYELNAQDNSRLCLAQAIVHGHLYNDNCFALDHARYKGHLYTDKAPGLSLLELPVAEALHLAPANELPKWSWQLWLMRVLTSGVLFLALAFLVGRVTEGLSPGFGSVSLVTFALGTLIAAFAAMSFDQVPAALLGFGAFLLAWRGDPLAAGVLAGTGVFFEYEAAAILVVVGAYLAYVTREARPVAKFLAGTVPGLVALAVYDQLAFGAPWRLSYSYVDNLFEPVQSGGLFGIHLPGLHATGQVLIGRGGLIVATPVLVAAAWGLALLWRAHRAEVAACVVVIAGFLILNFGYFLPYGGSPGPRFLLPALPFLALGLGPAFARSPRLTGALAVVSIVSMTALSLDWGAQSPMKGGIFGELARIPFQWGSSRFYQFLEPTAFHWLWLPHAVGAVITAAFALVAFVVAYRAIPAEKRRRVAAAGSRRATRLTVIGAAVACLVVVAEASAVSGFPYLGPPHDLAVSIQASTTVASPGQEVDFAVWSSNSSAYQGYGDVVLSLSLPPGTSLLGPPAYERGSGCVGTTGLVTCRLDSLSPKMSTPIRFGIRLVRAGPQSLVASLDAQGLGRPARVSVSIDSG